MQLWEDLARSHWGYLVQLCHRYLKDSSEAEDLAQEVLFKGYSHWNELVDKAKVRPWLGAIARRECLGRLRRQRRRHELAVATLPSETAFFPAIDEFEVHERLLHLDKNHRTILTDFYFREIPLDEIATHQGISHANARKRLERARGALVDVYENLSLENRIPHDVMILLKRPSLLWMESKVQTLWQALQREMGGFRLVDTDEFEAINRLAVFPQVPVFGARPGLALRPYFTTQLLARLAAPGERLCAVDRVWRPVRQETTAELRMFHMMEICCAGEILATQSHRITKLLSTMSGFPVERLVLTPGTDARGESLDVALDVCGQRLGLGECLQFAPLVLKKLCPKLGDVPVSGFAIGLDRLALVV